MKTNGLLKWLTVPVVLLVVFVLIRLFSESNEPGTPPESREPQHGGLTSDETKALGIESDTPQDTVATLVAQVKQLRSELKNALDENKQHRAESERMRLRDAAIDERIESAVKKERDQWQRTTEQTSSEQQRTQSIVDDLRRHFEVDKGKTPEVDLPVGLGLQDSDVIYPETTHWIEPQDALPVDRVRQRGSSSSQGRPPAATFSSLAETTSEGSAAFKEPAAETPDDNAVPSDDSAQPVYTASPDATLMGAVAMTALIGRIPVDGALNDPFPFKIIVGADNLMANGIELPELAGAIVSGTASGDWTLSCVRGQIKSVTFIFQDGTISTSRSASGSSDAGAAQGGLGYISDPYGIPCVSGVRRSNAQQYLTSQMLITAAGAGAASLIDSSTGSFSFSAGNNGNSIGTVGITGNEALERILASGVQEMSQWVNKLYGEAFAAVYVPPHAPVAVHIEQSLEIDYDPKGRKVNHQIGGSHAPDLD